ncbi:MAG: arylsulfatase, partial [Verrucomicrobia bacterium]
MKTIEPLTLKYLALSLLCSALALSAGAQAPRPNIVFIMVDDMGYSDIGCYGGEIETPHVDSLAESGLRFTNFRVTPMCVVSRASILSG